MSKKNVVIYGVGIRGNLVYEKIKNKDNLLFFVDDKITFNFLPNDKKEAFLPEKLKETIFDIIYIASSKAILIAEELVNNFCVDRKKISFEYDNTEFDSELFYEYALKPRIDYVEQFAIFARHLNMNGVIAEIGVLHGDFAKELNRIFYDKKLLLFDTFEGFNVSDMQSEKINNSRFLTIQEIDVAIKSVDISVEKVLEIMPHRENCVIYKGVVPNTFKNLKEEFMFVNLDVDLYEPTKESLEIIYPMMVKGGIIAIHDYFVPSLVGVRKAVDNFCKMKNLNFLPLGDHMSVIIQKI